MQNVWLGPFTHPGRWRLSVRFLQENLIPFCSVRTSVAVIFHPWFFSYFSFCVLLLFFFSSWSVLTFSKRERNFASDQTRPVFRARATDDVTGTSYPDERWIHFCKRRKNKKIQTKKISMLPKWKRFRKSKQLIDGHFKNHAGEIYCSVNQAQGV